jgi:hypothetical protein
MSLRETHIPQMFWPGLGNGKELLEAFYSMGWIVQPYRGYRCVRSGGNGYGFGMGAAFLPDEGLGAVVMTNLAHSLMTKIILRNICDRMLGLPQMPWNRRYLRTMEHREESAKKGSRRRGGKRRSTPSRPLEHYIGEYEHPAYGRLAVSLENGKLRLDHNGFPFRRMTIVETDTFRISLPTGYEKKASFVMDESGRAASVAIPLAPGVAEIAFKKVDD